MRELRFQWQTRQSVSLMHHTFLKESEICMQINWFGLWLNTPSFCTSDKSKWHICPTEVFFPFCLVYFFNSKSPTDLWLRRRWNITSYQRLIAAFHHTCWVTSEPAHLYHGNQRHTIVHAHTPWEKLAWHPALWRLEAFTNLSVANWTHSKPSVCHSTLHPTSSSLLIFALLF